MPAKPLTIVFCIPGTNFSGRFLECWSNLLSWCIHHGIRPVLSQKRSCNIYYVRNLCLGADVSRGPQQKPFNGKIDYNYLMWIDSDILFSPEQFQRLLSHNQDIVSGLYLMDGGEAYATVEHWDDEFFLNHGHFQFLTPKNLPGSVPSDNPQLLPVDYTGMGFMLVKRGVFESLEYPWFKPLEKRIGNMVDFTMEDVSFCLRAREKGYTVHVDPAIIVGHEKSVVI